MLLPHSRQWWRMPHAQSQLPHSAHALASWNLTPPLAGRGAPRAAAAPCARAAPPGLVARMLERGISSAGDAGAPPPWCALIRAGQLVAPRPENRPNPFSGRREPRLARHRELGIAKKALRSVEKGAGGAGRQSNPWEAGDALRAALGSVGGGAFGRRGRQRRAGGATGEWWNRKPGSKMAAHESRIESHSPPPPRMHPRRDRDRTVARALSFVLRRSFAGMGRDRRSHVHPHASRERPKRARSAHTRPPWPPRRGL
jgi:hypothetical protein